MFKCLFRPVLLQTANTLQQRLESEVSIFLSMVKNEENSGRSPEIGHISVELIVCLSFVVVLTLASFILVLKIQYLINARKIKCSNHVVTAESAPPVVPRKG